MSGEMIAKIRRLAFFIWRGLPPGVDLDDVASEAVFGALKARSGCEVIAAKRQIIAFLRQWNRGSRHGVWRPSKRMRDRSAQAPQERFVLDAETRARLARAVEVLTAKELAVIRAYYIDDEPQHETAARMGTTSAYLSRVKRIALSKLREQLEGAAA